MWYYLRNPYLLRVLAVLLADVLSLGAAAVLAWYLAPPPLSVTAYATLTGIGALCLLTALGASGSYRPPGGARPGQILVPLAIAFGLASVAGCGLCLLAPAPPGTLRAAAQVAAFGFPSLIAVRFLVRRLLGLPGFRQRVLVVGTGDLAEAVAGAIVERDRLGIELAGFLSNEGESVAALPVLGKFHQLEKIAKESQIDRIVVACRDDGSFPVDQLISLKVRGCRVEEAASFFERTTGRVHVRDLQAMDLALSEGFRWGAGASLLKRALDIVVASLALVVSAPILALFAVAIRLDSRGPLLFRQTRVGRDNRTFRIVKLRSMRDGAEEETGPVLCAGGDERVTRVGRILRLTRLDEVPQFWNVLVGDMSVVGPRPERPEFVQMLTERYPHFRWRCAVRPGITGWAQVRYGYVNEISAFEHKLALDLFYLKHRSLAMDCLVLWKTVKTVFLFHGL